MSGGSEFAIVNEYSNVHPFLPAGVCIYVGSTTSRWSQGRRVVARARTCVLRHVRGQGLLQEVLVLHELRGEGDRRARRGGIEVANMIMTARDNARARMTWLLC